MATKEKHKARSKRSYKKGLSNLSVFATISSRHANALEYAKMKRGKING